MESRTVELGGALHYADFGGEGPPAVLVHGLGGSHLNWVALGPLLTQHYRVLAPDLAGHGGTPLGERSARVRANVALLDRFLAEVADQPALLVGNSMGGLIALLAAADHPERVAGLVLVAPAVPIPARARIDPLVAATFALYALPRLATRVLARRRARLSPEQQVAESLAVCCVDPSRVPAEAVELAVAALRNRENDAELEVAFLAAARSLLAVLARPGSFAQRVQSVAAPALVVAGAGDRLIPLAAAQRLTALRPDWELEVLEGVGHVPQLEDPERLAATIIDWARRNALVNTQVVRG